MVLEVLSIIARVTSVFEDLKIDYYIGGSIASGQYGLPRLTRDVDFVADLREQHIERFVAMLAEDFYLDEQVIRRAIAARRSFNLIHLETVYKVDIFLAKTDPWSREEMNRKQLRPMGDGETPLTAYLPSPEDIILQKLRWFRQGGEVAAKQLEDVVGVLQVQAAALDYDYLNHWADSLGVADLLRNARALVAPPA